MPLDCSHSPTHSLSTTYFFSLFYQTPAQAASCSRRSFYNPPFYQKNPSSTLVSDRMPGMEYGDYTISSNPPNPKNSFRLGDWMYVAFLNSYPLFFPLVIPSQSPLRLDGGCCCCSQIILTVVDLVFSSCLAFDHLRVMGVLN
jgi:hypothetical protein